MWFENNFCCINQICQLIRIYLLSIGSMCWSLLKTNTKFIIMSFSLFNWLHNHHNLQHVLELGACWKKTMVHMILRLWLNFFCYWVHKAVSLLHNLYFELCALVEQTNVMQPKNYDYYYLNHPLPSSPSTKQLVVAFLKQQHAPTWAYIYIY